MLEARHEHGPVLDGTLVAHAPVAQWRQVRQALALRPIEAPA